MPSPSRRSFLASLGSLASLSVAGCLGDDSLRSDPATKTTQSTTSEEPTRITSVVRNATRTTRASRETTALSTENVGGAPPQVGVESGWARPFAVETVGSRPGGDSWDHRPHGVWIWNDSPDERRISVEVSDGSDIVKSIDEEYPSDAYLTLMILEPTDFTLEVGLVGSDSTKTIEIPADWIDCNESGTGVMVREDGPIETRTFSTEVLCSTPTPGTTSEDRARS